MKICDYLATDFQRSLRYLPHILSTVNVEGTKVLYIRAKTSGLVAVLRKVCGASQVDVTTLFPAVKYLCEKNDGVRAICDVDFEDFKIPYADKYDLIIENHILIHMIDSKSTFAMLTEHLNENGAIFLRHELDDVRLFGKSKNLFAELRPFHFNQFDIPALERMLQRFGFDPVGIRHRIDGKSEVIGTARLNGNARKKFQPISREQLKARLQMYAQWRDESILSLPTERCRALFGDEVREVWQRIDKRVGFSRTRHRKMIRKFAEANIREEDVELFAETLRRKPSLRKSGASLKSRLFGRNWLQSS